MDFYNYWKFFFEHTFAKEAKLNIFDDGSFAISTPLSKTVTFYSKDAEHIVTHFHAHVFENGCIAREDGDHISILFNDTVLYKLSLSKDDKVLYYTNALGIFAKEVNYLYFIEPNQSAPMEMIFNKNEYAIETSTTKMVYGKKEKGDKWLMDQNHNRLPIDDIHRVDFLPCGSYIVFFKDVGAGCSLYNADHVKLLHSEEAFGIQRLGVAVSYQNSLIINPKNGKILMEYANEIAITKSGVRVYPYTLKAIRLRYWLGGELIDVYSKELGNILYYWHDGHFYFAPQCSHKLAIAVEGKNSDPNWIIYLQRVKDLMLDY